MCTPVHTRVSEIVLEINQCLSNGVGVQLPRLPRSLSMHYALCTICTVHYAPVT